MISAVVITKNEEKNIVDCLETLSFCNEIVIIDDYSDDRTAEIARRLGAKVFTHFLNNDFSAQRNFGLEKAKGEWILFVDADEKVTSGLASEIIELTSHSSEFNGANVQRIDFMLGKKMQHGEIGNVKFLRLGRKGLGGWEGKVHEKWKIQEPITSLENPIEHFPHKTIDEFLKEINYYTYIRAKELFDKGVRVSAKSIVGFPTAKFIVNYFLKLGLLDGLPGFIVAVIMSFHSFLVRGKLWLLWQRR